MHLKSRFLLIILLAIASVSFTKHTSNITIAKLENYHAMVKICTGGSSYAYHAYYCQGLKKCKAAVQEVSVQEAKKMGRKACGYCY